MVLLTIYLYSSTLLKTIKTILYANQNSITTKSATNVNNILVLIVWLKKQNGMIYYCNRLIAIPLPSPLITAFYFYSIAVPLLPLLPAPCA